MLNYEYKVGKFSRHYGEVENLINGLAQKGWRLICVSDGFHYFERPVYNEPWAVQAVGATWTQEPIPQVDNANR